MNVGTLVVTKMSLAEQFYLYNSEQQGPQNGWGAYFDEAAEMTDDQKASFAYELDALETTAGEAATFDRNAQWQKRSRGSTEQLRADLEAKEKASCTFTPRINSRSPRAGTANAGSRLHELHTRTLSERRAKRVAAEAKEVNDLTFQPRLVRSSWTDNVAPRYLDPQQDTTNVDPDDSCTFQPYVNRTVTPGVERYLSVPVHERLNHRSARAPTPSSASTKKIDKDQLDAFVARSAKAEEERKRKIMRLKRETEASAAPGPTVLRNTNITVSGSLSKHAQAMQLRKAARIRDAERDAECSFAPRIHTTPTSRKRPPNAVFQPNRVHMKEALRDKAEREREEAAHNTFKPHLSPATRRTKGKVVPALKSAETFDLFVKQVKAVRQADIRHWREEEEQRLQEECTFAPQTSDVPAAVHAIATSLHVAGPPQEESSYLQPLRY